jgi:hypothetical protein
MGQQNRLTIGGTLKRIPLLIRNGAKFGVALIAARVLQMTSRSAGIWLICERPDEARDNGYHLFRHIRTRHPEVHAFYVIAPTSPDRDRVTVLGHVIRWGSFRHYLYWCLAECVISAHAGKCAPEPHLSWRLSRARLVSHRSVLLQHGVIANSCPEFMLRSQAAHDLISATALPEQTFLTAVAGHEEGVVRILGLCRFDALHEPVERRRDVLLMPTWRRWFRGLSEKYGQEKATRLFRESEYFRTYDALLQSDRLHRVLEDVGYRLIFYPHYGVQEYLEAFGETHERVILADRRRYDVQRLLKESAVLVTDYSSVSFDFAYMGKPLIYIQPDAERYFTDHFQRGYFDYNRDGFGPVTHDPEAAVDVLGALLTRGAAQDPMYRRRVEAFFALQDDQNCKRTFAAIQEMLARRQVPP